jgi:hydroxymethylglutaryl-CoA synthase
MEQSGLKVEDFDYIVPHQPNGSFPVRVARMLGFEDEKIKPGLISPIVGNFYSGSSIAGLCRVLDQAKPGERILLVSYGSGAGADAFSLIVQDAIEEKRNLAPTFDYYLQRKIYINYAIYAKFRKKIKFA